MKLQSFSLQMYQKVNPAQVLFFENFLNKLSEQLFYESLHMYLLIKYLKRLFKLHEGSSINMAPPAPPPPPFLKFHEN